MSITKTEAKQGKHSKSQAGWQKRAFQVVKQVHSQIDFSNALQTLVQEVIEALQADRCFIINFDESKNTLPVSIEARSSDSIPSVIGELPPWQQCPYLQKVEAKQFVWAEDTLTDQHLDAKWKHRFTKYRVRGFIASPIIHEGEILCVLIVHTQEPRAWTQGELLFAQASTAQAAASISQAHAMEINYQLQESQEKYQKLHDWEKKSREVMRIIRQSTSGDKTNGDNVFPMAIAEMAKSLNADRAFIIEFENGKVCPIRYEYRSNETILPFTGIAPPWNFCPYLAKSAQHEMAWSTDTYNDLIFAGNETWYHFSRKYTIRSIVTTPILYSDTLMNVVVFHTNEPRHWSEQELFFIKVVSDQFFTLYYQEKARAELMRAAQIKNDFLSKMSHELRTPLNAIIGYAKMIEKQLAGPITDKQAEYIHYVGSSGGHLLNLVNDILDVSKIEAGKMSIYPETTDIASLISEIRPMVEEQAKKKNLHLSFQVQPKIGSIEADPGRLKQILLNLISNAIKFNRANGTISVRLNKTEEHGSPLKMQDGWLIAEVQDTGIGIPYHKINELFNQFHQIDNSGSRAHEGSGLGLVLAKELVELHNGIISVISTEGIGTTFTVKLPLASKALQQDPASKNLDHTVSQ